MSNRRMRNLGCVSLAVMVWAAGMAAAETLTDTLVSAYNNSHLLEQNRAVLRAADEDVAQAVALLRPTLDYQLSRGWDYDFDEDRYFISDTIDLVASLTIYEFGRNRLAIEAAKEAVLAARQSLLAEEQAVLFDAVTAYFQVRNAIALVGLAENNVSVLNEELRATRDRFEVGEVTRTDVAQAESRFAEAQARLVEARGDFENQREGFRLAVGRYPNNLDPAPPEPVTADSVEDARAVARREHPSILEAQRLVTVAELNAARAEAAVLPSLAATASAGWGNSPNNPFDNNLDPQADVGLSITGPIYQGGALNSVFRQAQAQRDQNRANLLQTTASIIERVGVAWATLRSARATFDATERQIMAAQIAFDGVREEATLGARTTLDVLDAEQDLLDARVSRVEALTSEQIAIYGLLSTMGRLTVDYLELPVIAYDPSIYYNSVRNAPAIGSRQGIQLDRVLKSIGRY